MPSSAGIAKAWAGRLKSKEKAVPLSQILEIAALVLGPILFGLAVDYAVELWHRRRAKSEEPRADDWVI